MDRATSIFINVELPVETRAAGLRNGISSPVISDDHSPRLRKPSACYRPSFSRNAKPHGQALNGFF
jgi:hypothetical protein